MASLRLICINCKGFRMLFPNWSVLVMLACSILSAVYTGFPSINAWNSNLLLWQSNCCAAPVTIITGSFEVSGFVSSWRLDGSEFQAFGPAYEKTSGGARAGRARATALAGVCSALALALALALAWSLNFQISKKTSIYVIKLNYIVIWNVVNAHRSSCLRL